jgi:hypothetical protein
MTQSPDHTPDRRPALPEASLFEGFAAAVEQARDAQQQSEPTEPAQPDNLRYIDERKGMVVSSENDEIAAAIHDKEEGYEALHDIIKGSAERVFGKRDAARRRTAQKKRLSIVQGELSAADAAAPSHVVLKALPKNK